MWLLHRIFLSGLFFYNIFAKPFFGNLCHRSVFHFIHNFLYFITQLLVIFSKTNAKSADQDLPVLPGQQIRRMLAHIIATCNFISDDRFNPAVFQIHKGWNIIRGYFFTSFMLALKSAFPSNIFFCRAATLCTDDFAFQIGFSLNGRVLGIKIICLLSI